MIFARFTTYLFVVMLGISTMNAQTSSSTETSIPYKWDVSVDVYELLKSGTGNTLLRYAPNPDKFAYRLNVSRLGFNHSTSDNQNNSLVKHTSQYFHLEASLGIECRKTFDRFQLYTGPSIYFLTQIEQTKADYQTNRTYTDSRESTTFAVGPEAISGIRYFIWPRLALSAESAFRMTYQSERVTTSSDSKSHYFTGRFVPLKAIHVSFFF